MPEYNRIYFSDLVPSRFSGRTPTEFIVYTPDNNIVLISVFWTWCTRYFYPKAIYLGDLDGHLEVTFHCTCSEDEFYIINYFLAVEFITSD